MHNTPKFYLPRIHLIGKTKEQVKKLTALYYKLLHFVNEMKLDLPMESGLIIYIDIFK